MSTGFQIGNPWRQGFCAILIARFSRMKNWRWESSSRDLFRPSKHYSEFSPGRAPVCCSCAQIGCAVVHSSLTACLFWALFTRRCVKSCNDLLLSYWCTVTSRNYFPSVSFYTWLNNGTKAFFHGPRTKFTNQKEKLKLAKCPFLVSYNPALFYLLLYIVSRHAY